MVWPRYYDQVNGHFVRNRRKEINFRILVYVGIALMFITSTLFAPILFFGFVVYR